MKYSFLIIFGIYFFNVQISNSYLINNVVLQNDKILYYDTLPEVVSVAVDAKLFGHFNDSKDAKTQDNKKNVVKLKSDSNQYSKVLELGFKMKKDLSCFPNIGEIEKLANAFKLTVSTKYNPKCKYDIGDISSWSEQGLSVDKLILEFATRRIALEALDSVGFTIEKRKRKEGDLQGILSAIAKEFQSVSQIQDKWIELLGNYKECKENEATISILVKGKVLLIKSFRINEVKEMMDNAPKGEYSKGYLNKLATYYKLPGFGGEYECNPALWYLEDDLNHFFEKYENSKNRIEKINKEFASRRVIIDGADLDNSPCFKFYNLPDISWVAEDFIIPKL